jgi:hypothetical protein
MIEKNGRVDEQTPVERPVERPAKTAAPRGPFTAQDADERQREHPTSRVADAVRKQSQT